MIYDAAIGLWGRRNIPRRAPYGVLKFPRDPQDELERSWMDFVRLNPWSFGEIWKRSGWMNRHPMLGWALASRRRLYAMADNACRQRMMSARRSGMAEREWRWG